MEIADNGTVSLPEVITRDEVTVSEPTTVVTVVSSAGTEEIKVYADGTQGTTEKTETQNKDVNSALGQLVLDNGSEQKALDADAKEEVKEEIVEEAQNEEAVEKAEDAGYVITHHEALEPTCTEDGHTAYDSYFVNSEEVKIGYKVIPATGHAEPDEDGKCTVCGEQIYSYKVGSNFYASINDAWTAAKNSSYDLKLLADVTLNALQVYADYSIDLNGKTLTLRGHANAGTTGGAIYIDGGANSGHGHLTIKNGTLDMPGTNFSTYGIYNYGTLTMQDVTINSNCSTVIYVNGQAWGSAGTTTLEGVTINSTNTSGTAFAAYSLKSFSTVSPIVSINDCEVTSAKNGVMIYACQANVSNTEVTVPSSQNGIWISRSSMASGITNTLTLSGNVSVNGGSSYSAVHAQDGNAIVAVAGTYNFDPTSYVDAENYSVSDNGDGTWTVSAK